VGKGQKIFYRWHTKAVKVKGTQSTNKATLYKNKGEWGGGGASAGGGLKTVGVQLVLDGGGI